MVMDMSLTSPDDLPPLAGYDPSLTCTESERGPPSTIGDPEHSGTGSILGIGGAIPAQPPQVPPNTSVQLCRPRVETLRPTLAIIME